jgi:hypothetical protein
MPDDLLACSYFRFWHKCEVPTALGNVCFQGQPGSHLLTMSSSQLDPLQTSCLGVAHLRWLPRRNGDPLAGRARHPEGRYMSCWSQFVPLNSID